MGREQRAGAPSRRRTRPEELATSREDREKEAVRRKLEAYKMDKLVSIVIKYDV